LKRGVSKRMISTLCIFVCVIAISYTILIMVEFCGEYFTDEDYINKKRNEKRKGKKK